MGAVTWTAYNTADDISNAGAFNSLADGSGAISAEVDNSTGLYMFGDLEVTMGGAVTSSGLDARIDVYLVPTYDGTNYPTPGGATTFTGTQWCGTISSVETVGTVAVTSYTNGTCRGILLPPTKFKIGLVNELGAAFNGTATVKLRRYNSTVA